MRFCHTDIRNNGTVTAVKRGKQLFDFGTLIFKYNNTVIKYKRIEFIVIQRKIKSESAAVPCGKRKFGAVFRACGSIDNIITFSCEYIAVFLRIYCGTVFLIHKNVYFFRFVYAAENLFIFSRIIKRIKNICRIIVLI